MAVMLMALLPLSAARGQQAERASPLHGLALDVEFANARILSAREGTVLDPRTILVVGYGLGYEPTGSRLGVAVRVRGSSQEGDLGYGDLSASFAFSHLAAEGGVAWRRGYDLSTGLLHGTVHRVGRVGLRYRRPLHATPLRLQWRAGAYLPLAEADGANEPPRGWEGESSLIYDFTRSPASLRVGFRFERFRVNRVEQELSMIQVAMTWRGVSEP
jgi:hypothetical protein